MRGEGDSLGGVVECTAVNLPVGLGEPVFGSLDSDLARMALSIPAAKGVEFGSGFEGSRMTATQNNDQYYLEGGKLVSRTNNSGGILGGLSNGMALRYRIAFKRASSIAATQKTGELSKNAEVELVVRGAGDLMRVASGVTV